MHTVLVLHKLLHNAVPTIHVVRLASLMAAVQSVLSGAQVSVTSLGRYIFNPAFVKHKIKRMDRLLGNHKLYQERLSLYGVMIQQLLQGLPQPIILIDWSPLTADQEQQLLRASIPVKGRSLTLYEEIHPRSKLGNRKVQQVFLVTLQSLLPAGCRPIVVADSGFRVPFYRFVEQTLGWSWVGRIRNRDFIASHSHPEQWFSATSLYHRATTRAVLVGSLWWVRKHPLSAFLVLIRSARKGRRKLTTTGKTSQSRYSLKQAQREREPWLLVASLSLLAFSPKQIVKLYRTRMQIEEGFRDTKSDPYGLGLAKATRISSQRRAILLLIAALAIFVLWCIGTAVKALSLAKQVRVNSSSKRPAYSVIFLARLLLQHSTCQITHNQMQQSLMTIKLYMNDVLCA